MTENDIYDGYCISQSGYEEHHVFDRAFLSEPIPTNVYPICRCGYYKKKSCKCAECDNSHRRVVAIDENERLAHEIFKLNLRLDALEGSVYMAGNQKADELTQ